MDNPGTIASMIFLGSLGTAHMLTLFYVIYKIIKEKKSNGPL